MVSKEHTMIDGNEAAAYVAYRTNEVIAIYPITPSSPMGEWADLWESQETKNIWGSSPTVVEMQSEGGAAGAIHGALQAGSLATTFTASQGLLLMIPNMYKIAGELTPTVFHVAARSLAVQALSIFGDHSDVMAARSTGFAFLCSASVQEAMDFALIAQSATLQSRIPFVHFFDGFRTSHEISKIEVLPDDTIRQMIPEDLVHAHKARALSPDHPVMRGTTQNPDVYFQARESVNTYYDQCSRIVSGAMKEFAKLTGRTYAPFEYAGDSAAERVIVLMGSGCETAEETVQHLQAQGEKVGVVKVRLFRPFDSAFFLSVLPKTARTIAVLDRTKESGAPGEPLYLDCLSVLAENQMNGEKKFDCLPKVVGGRYGLSSKEFTPGMVKGIFDHLKEANPKKSFTIGITDDVTHLSLPYDPEFSIESKDTYRAVFYGLGSDGTVGANKNSIKIIGHDEKRSAQGYFVYDSRKSGATTVSHLRFGPKVIRAPYLISQAHFIGCHQWTLFERYDILKHLLPNGKFLLNSIYGPDDVWRYLPGKVQAQLKEKNAKFYVIDAYKVAKESGIGSLINTVMQVCFFAISKIMPIDEAVREIEESIRKTYGKKGQEIVDRNLKAVHGALQHLHEVNTAGQPLNGTPFAPPIPKEAPPFVREVLGTIVQGCGDDLPVGVFPIDGTYPTGTSKWEQRNLTQEVPVWDPDVCIQCGKCAFVCPHGVIRVKAYEDKHLKGAPQTFKSRPAKDLDWKDLTYTIQVATDYCTGCGICVDICPAKNKSKTSLKAINMEAELPIRETERENWDFFSQLPELDRRRIKSESIRQEQVQQPLFEFSSACLGCGETPYIKLATQLFGDRMVVANATGCSSIYGGNLPTTPWTHNADGRGPAWSNSLFEDNAEFGLGMRLSIDQQRRFAIELLLRIRNTIEPGLVNALIESPQKTEADIYEQRERVELLKKQLKKSKQKEAERLLAHADMLVKKSVWIIGGDGWAYDIGYGGLDHVLASGKNVNILVLDTEVYSNTGGQMSKSTPKAAVAKFAANGKAMAKKDLGLIAMTYGNVYVASVAMGAKDEHTLKAFLEAEAYDGPSLIIAYSHCIAHGINMTTAMQNQKALVQSGRWLLYRYHPERGKAGQDPLILERPGKKISLEQYMNMENRFKMLAKSHPETARYLWEEASEELQLRMAFYEYLATFRKNSAKKPEPQNAEVK
ncbi:MAG: pyruvate:ferredoxin (flavodoxin) oxidoreductase [Candidatus Omnitrophica bacterium CG11_big_fil_rev_8_21_14_0_20_45_26]|uniref:Pyruvate:ferredoxin (Flavodoxin) oxidoreductase n=1 Tax=Candidatus Abzuiibacterium crystallinum TaxID=1974748 RepID=A0A2H0LR54_9BACT|nr:MAG: pyruvate:ferredoxin (flavodoxin) oxidoreductase [Candidatus Omnitrophica bacterium CG11_big_fil_rev_8_21_14_0_20_45_26]PIW65746.1 MAG: pyruvate:ferredoxin (flavodoxin) oxidoreductase [Candidatus Omnitrophica bacterium CG12_big_fil_rev_8_21_14_0_65_45_16]